MFISHPWVTINVKLISANTSFRIECFQMITMICRLMRDPEKEAYIPTKMELCRHILFLQIDVCVVVSVSIILACANFDQLHMIVWQSLLLSIIFIQNVLNLCISKLVKTKKKTSLNEKSHSLASSYQFFSNRIHRLASQELKSFGMIDVPLDARTGRTYIV